MNPAARRLRFRIRNRLGNHDRMIPRLAPHSHWRHGEIKPDSELCIEGFPRSANTFALAAFQIMQPGTVKVAHHSHLPGQVIRALRFQVPVLLLIRTPLDALASLLVRETFVTPAIALHYYRTFHHRLRPVIDQVTVADFDQVIQDYGSVIRRLNREQERDWQPWDPTPERQAACTRLIEEMDRADRGSADVSEAHVARPSQARRAEQEKWAKVLSSPRYAGRLAECQAVYQEFRQVAFR